jgi:glycosyltransferase involved in cell wall biosynthesis
VKVFIPDFWTEQKWGVARGYYHIFLEFSKGLTKLGATITHDPEEDVDIDLYICPPAVYERRRYASVLYTMWENVHIDRNHLEGFKEATQVVVPSQFCFDLFRPESKCEMSIVPLGIGEEFTFKKRKPKGKFRWLFVGSSNFRKGTDVIHDVWKHLLSNQTMELYIKTTGDETIEQGIFQMDSNVIVDTRRVDQSDLVDIYHSADAFLFPTSGEGFGLTLAEAMSTGLPCICTEYSGHLDFTDKDSVYYIGLDHGGERLAANAADLAREMKHLVTDYRKALLKGRKASRAVSRLTWDSSCRGVYKVLRNTC